MKKKHRAIKIKKISSTKIQVAGIKPKYNGVEKITPIPGFSEIREEKWDDKETLHEIEVKTDGESINLLKNEEAECDKAFINSLNNMDQWSFMKQPIKDSVQNYIKFIFSNIYPEIEFTDDYDDSFSDIQEYFNQEIGKNDEKIQQKLHDFDKHPLEIVKEGTAL